MILKKFLQSKSGATAIEYGLIAAAIGIGTITATTNVGTSLSETFCRVGASIGGGAVCGLVSSTAGNFSALPRVGTRSRNYVTYGVGTEIADGWDVTDGTVDVMSNSYSLVGPLEDGDYAIDLYGRGVDGTLTKTLDTVPGQEYTVSFDYSQSNQTTVDKQVFFQVNGDTQTREIFTSDGNQNFQASKENYQWNQGSYTFTATNAQTQIDMTSLGGGGGTGTGVYIKNIQIGF